MIYTETALVHHLFQISIAELIPAIPSDAQENKRWLEVSPLERRFALFQKCDSRRVMDEPD
jgi:hypothetical protein